MNWKTIAGVVLIVVSLLNPDLSKLSEYLKQIKIPETPALVIDKPADSMVQLVTPVANLITDKEDKQRLAVFAYEFSQRRYQNTTMQNINDIVTEAGKIYFKGSMTGKYPGLAEGLKKLLSECQPDSADTKLPPSALEDIRKRFEALAWALIQ